LKLFGPNDPIKNNQNKKIDTKKKVVYLFDTLVTNNKRWSSICFLLIGCLIISVVLNFVQAMQPKIMPYIIEVNKDTGLVTPIGKINNVSYKVNQNLIKSIISRFTQETRTVPRDANIYGSNIEKAYNYLTNKTKKQLLYYIKEDKIKEKLQNRETIIVEIKSIIRVSGTQNTWQVRWQETDHDASGEITGTKKMVGTYTIAFKPVYDQKTILENPTGLIITDFSQTVEL